MVVASPDPHRRRRFPDPIVVVAAPGSGADALVAALAGSPDVVALRGSAAELYAATPHLLPRRRGWDSARLGLQDAKPGALTTLEAAWAVRAGLDEAADQPTDGPTDGRTDGPTTRLLLGYDEAALHVGFLAAAYPRARFVFVQRDVVETLDAMVARWASGTDVAHRDLPGWSGPAWTSALTPGWRQLVGRDLLEVVADQWRRTTETVRADLQALPLPQWTAVGHAELGADPRGEVERLCGFLGITPPADLGALEAAVAAGPVASVADAPAFATVLAALGDTASRVRELVTSPRHREEAPEGSPFRSVSTPAFAELLDKAGTSLLATTYQTGRLVVARTREGRLNTHFRRFESPMGIAYGGGVLALGTKRQVWQFTDVPGAARGLPGGHDACFLPRTTHFTGDIRIHDVSWAQGELWAVATRFSCLVTFDGRSSFVPRWRPPFVTALAPEDRCHLNGLAVVDGRVKYVTALGTTDTEGGWRPGKATGGVIMDVETDEVVAAGISMPHSPRWHRGRLWVLESGEGTLATVDLATGRLETVAVLPGFTRGLAFIGRYAVVGLSEVREATTFGGLPLTARLEERECGVWIVDTETGAVAGYLRFVDVVQEIFDVTVLPGVRWPEILGADSEAMLHNFVVPPEALAPS